MPGLQLIPFWVIKGKSTGRGKISPSPPPRLGLITCNFKVQPIKNLTQQMFYWTAVQFLTRNLQLVALIYKLITLQFHWNLQLLTLYSLFRILPCSTSSLLAVATDRIFVALNVFGVSRTIALGILNVFVRDRGYYCFFSKN